MAQRWNMTVYRLRDEIDGEQSNFQNVVRNPETIMSHSPVDPDTLDFDAILYLSFSDPKEPQWAEFVGSGFADLEFPEVPRVDGLLLVQVRHMEQDPLFAFTFGQGRHLLKQGSMVSSHGLAVALNAIYREAADRGLVRSVDSKTVAGNVFNTRRQADHRTTFEAFSVDTRRDFLRTIIGRPSDVDLWGTRISGGHSLNANPAIDFSDLGMFCRRIFDAYLDGSPPDEFAWIDKLKPVSSTLVREDLREEAVKLFAETDDLILAVPDLIDWENVAHFTLSCLPGRQFHDLGDMDLTNELGGLERPKAITLKNMRRWKLEAYNADGELDNSWSLINCISGQFEFNGETVVISEGEFYIVQADFLEELNSFVAEIPETEFPLPVAQNDPPEGEYNEHAAHSSENYLLLDKETVKLNSQTSAIEVCDILTADGAFIHVKRKLGSSSLSHLFAQGSVSADLLLMSPEFRRKVDEKIASAEQKRIDISGDESFDHKFPRFADNPIEPPKHEIVYAVAAGWKGRELVDALPFFSKINLRRHVEELQRMGYPISFAKIEATPRE